MKNITLLGSTGSIGCNALDVIGNHPKQFNVKALAAGENINILRRQIEQFKPEIVSVKNKATALALRETVTNKKRVKIVYGADGLNEVASNPSSDMVISALSGSAGFMPTLAAIRAGKNIALANKETMVLAGEIVTTMARKKNVKIIPVDSEHSAVFQCLEGRNRDDLQKIILTASGGPFLNLSRRELKNVTVRQALRHPKWKMGKKITVDSATMMNKGLEIIEAKWLFDADIKDIEVLIHPQSVIHSMVEFTDGVLLAQMGMPDMRVPIAYALTYPERIKNTVGRLNLIEVKHLDFFEPDVKKFPCLTIAREAAIMGGTAPAVLNAADEITVDAFLKSKIRFTDLPVVIEKVLGLHEVIHHPSVSDILGADAWARTETQKIIERMLS